MPVPKAVYQITGKEDQQKVEGQDPGEGSEISIGQENNQQARKSSGDTSLHLHI